MSPRIKKLRKVLNPPPVKGFKPYGGDPEAKRASVVTMHYEEYEALRLCDYDRYNHHQASVMMGVSRPTFTRIYASAREKIATAFVEGRQISVEGGKVYFDSDWYQCSSCDSYFNNPDRQLEIDSCPLCGSEDINGHDPDPSGQLAGTDYHEDRCICQSCGYEKEHRFGKPCSQEVCPQCNSRMRRMRSSSYRNRKRGGR
ncbi:MAG: DUF134 domain-containing protein [Bacteroidales bacterium]